MRTPRQAAYLAGGALLVAIFSVLAIASVFCLIDPFNSPAHWGEYVEFGLKCPFEALLPGQFGTRSRLGVIAWLVYLSLVLAGLRTASVLRNPPKRRIGYAVVLAAGTAFYAGSLALSVAKAFRDGE